MLEHNIRRTLERHKLNPTVYQPLYSHQVQLLDLQKPWSRRSPGPPAQTGGLTVESLEKLSEEHRKTQKAQSVADYCEVSKLPPGSPNIPPSEPSIIASSIKHPFDTHSERSSLFVDNDTIMSDAHEPIES
jgi:hypothetical protein